MRSITEKIKIRKALIMFIFLSNLGSFNNIVFSNTNNNIQIGEKDFDKALNQYSSHFHEYENEKNLFDDFFGLSDPSNENTFKTNFQDLSLQVESNNLRDLYVEKLKEMSKELKNKDKNKSDWSFFNKKI